MNDSEDLLLAEFHAAGIFTEEERRAREEAARRREREDAFNARVMERLKHEAYMGRAYAGPNPYVNTFAMRAIQAQMQAQARSAQAMGASSGVLGAFGGIFGLPSRGTTLL